MSATITGKLNADARTFQAGDSTGFNVRLGEQYYDRTAKKKEWTNYSAVIFAKNPAQIEYLTGVLTKGAIVSVTCKQQKIDSYEGQNGVSLSIEMIDASIQTIHFLGAEQAAPRTPAAPAPNAAPVPAGFDDMPF